MFHLIFIVMKNSSRIDIYQLVTDLIIERLENGIIPWKKSWNDCGPAVNYVTKKPYRGINQLILNGLHLRPFYLTFRQATSLGGRIKKGAKSIPVCYWNFMYRHADTGKRIDPNHLSCFAPCDVVKTAFIKYYRVFNIVDIQQIKFEIPELHSNESNFSIEKCDTVLFEMHDRPELRHQGSQPYYHPLEDYINMPPIEFFTNSELYYSILFHELIHSTGHTKRLNRFEHNQISTFNSTSYSKEELVAEIGAAFLNGFTGILNDETLTDSTAYIQGWLSRLRHDKKFIIEAAAKAQKAVDYILNFERHSTLADQQVR